MGFGNLALYKHYGIASDLFTSAAGQPFAGELMYVSATSFGIRAADGSTLYFTGGGLVWDDTLGKFTAGTVTAIAHYTNGNFTDQLNGFSLSATVLETAFEAGNANSLQALLMAGGDTLDARWQIDGGTAGVVLKGFGGDDLLLGGAGDDTLIGGQGADTMRGGAGSDVYYVDNYGDTVDETGGSGLDLIKSSVSVDLSDLSQVKGQVENLTITGTAYTAIGNDLDNVITGNAVSNILGGEVGNDTIKAGGGDDWIWGGTGSDKLYGGDGNDHFWGDSGNDLLSGGSGDDVMYGSSGNDTYVGGAGADTVVYTRSINDLKITVKAGGITIVEPHGVDTLIGVEQIATDEGVFVYDQGTKTWVQISDTPGELLLRPGSDLQGSAGNDTISLAGTGKSIAFGNAGDDTITGTNGYELIKGGDGNDVLYGDASRTNGAIDRIFGDGGSDIIYGCGGDDILYGGDGADTLHGGNGDDELTGGAGADLFVFIWDGSPNSSQCWGYDVIRDFQIGVDHLEFDYVHLSHHDDVTATLTQTAAGALITLSGCGSILLQGVDATGHTLADFLV